MATYVPAKRATEYIFYVGLESVATAGTFQANPTTASGDWKLSKDGGTLANLTTLPTVTPASGKLVKVTLSSAEMDADNVTVIASDASGGEWKDLIINIQTAARQIDDLAYPNTSGRGIDVATGGEVGIDWANIGNPTTTVNLSGTTVKTATDVETDTQDIQTRIPAVLVSGRIDASVGAMAAGAITAAAIATDAIDADALAADAVTEIQSGLATAAALTTVDTVVDAILVDTAEIGTAGAGLTALASATNLATLTGYVDTEVAAIKAKTDLIPATPANEATLTTIAGYLDTEVAAILSAVDTEVGAIKTVTDNLPNAGALTTITNNVAAILTDTGTEGVVLSTSQMQALADIVLGRSVSTVESTASLHSLTELILAILESSTATGSLVIKRTDGSTTFNTRTLATDADAVPIVGVS